MQSTDSNFAFVVADLSALIKKCSCSVHLILRLTGAKKSATTKAGRFSCGVVLAALFFVAFASPSYAESDGIPLERLGAMLEAARMVEQHRGGTTVDLMELIEEGGDEMNAQLDRYSRLMGSDAYKLERSRLTGEFGGLGVVIRREYAGVRVQKIIAGSPDVMVPFQKKSK